MMTTDLTIRKPADDCAEWNDGTHLAYCAMCAAAAATWEEEEEEAAAGALGILMEQHK